MSFIDKIFRLAMIILLDLKTGCANMIESKLTRNVGFLDITNNSLELHIFSKNEALGIVDLRSNLYYTVKHNILQHYLKSYHEFRPLYYVKN